MKNFTRAMVSALVMVLILSFSMTGAAQAASPARIAIVCSAAGQNDTGYNKSACDSVKQLSTDLGIEYKIVEPANGVAAALETLAEDGYNLIFNLEYDFDALVKGVGGADAIAAQYPDTWFVVFNADPNRNEDGTAMHKNVISVLFDVHEGSYLSGYAYVYMNENQKELFGDGYNMTAPDAARAVGFVGGTNSDGILVFSYGFMQGMERACTELDAKYDYYAKYDAGFGDPALGATVAGTMFDNGANAVFAVAGVVGDGIASKAREVGKLAIEVDGNLDAQQPGHIITSVLKNTGTPVATITKAYVDGSIGAMENLQSYNIASGGTGITDMSEISKYVKNADVFGEIKAKVAAVQDEIAAGTQKIVNRQIGEEFDPVTACPHLTIK
ncbi:MAG: BMP family ABC transporter substrate-binding protein [Christensenellaceae bacterium]|nr:BMP family ABC transporter substrate-binding protein [Christensenellaceae bacterium]MEA5065044.1 BMP family ABC transporter substrate-binding protein [Eubacteriales bacterium]MEA5068013.1 BMP family ABC transporter substrate-binding protein [Christensenellaceae bacterium]